MHGERLWSRRPLPGDPALPGAGPAGGSGGNRVAYITLPSIPGPAAQPKFTVKAPTPPPKRVQTAAPEPVPVSQIPPEPVDAAAEAPPPDTSVAGFDGGPGPGAGETAGTGGAAGTGAGVGPGTGPGTGGGEGGSRRPPEPRDMAFPFDSPPKELRGASLDVTFWVRADGRVERYQVAPRIRDRKYAKQFDEIMRAFRFTPARAPNGSRVADTITISVTLPGKSSS
jgi:hypothetical protein